jgi:hypothetical protein
MTRSASSFKSPKDLLAVALAFAVLAFAPSSAFAQHGGGGHMGGGGFGGGHSGGGGGFGGGSHSSTPASSHSAAPARSAPVTAARGPAYSPVSRSEHPASTTSSANGNAVVRTPNFGTPASTNASGPTTFALHGQAAAPHTTVIGFPPSDSHVAPVTPALRNGSGALSFSGQGHEIWQDTPAQGASNNVAAAHPSTSERILFGRSPSVITRPFPPHGILYEPIFFGPAFYPGFGYFGNGFCGPFSGFDPAFGCGGFGYGGGFGLGYGFGYGYGGYFGSSYDNSFGVGSASGAIDFENDTPSNDYGTYSPEPAPEQGTDQSSQSVTAAPPPTTLIYLKDGTNFDVMSYWLDAGKLHYVTNYGGETTVDMSQLDLQRTVDENARLGVDFTLRPNPQTPPATQAAPAAQPTPDQQPSLQQ